MDDVSAWIEQSPYTAGLGVALDAHSDEAVRLSLPYRDENSNGDRALHGGVAATLSGVGAHALARAALGAEAGPWHLCALQVSYLSAAKGEGVAADARLLRRGKEICFVEVDVSAHDGRPIAHATAAVRGRFGAEEPERAAAAGDDGASDPGPMGPFIGRVPFIAGRGIAVEHMAGGSSRLVMPLLDANGDAAGGVHEGAVLALLDTAGAMAAWAETGPGRYKASTPAIQAQILAPPRKADHVAYGRCVQRDREVFFCGVDVADASDGRLVSRGTVIYRIVT